MPGAVLIFVGVQLDSVIPIIKKLWTDSFVLFSSGVAILVLAAIYWLEDVHEVALRQRSLRLQLDGDKPDLA
jgi:predicted acyltransferase